ncbi:MAG: 2-phospho-L-lactate guanylyltransferase [Pseudomonadales bacterium]
MSAIVNWAIVPVKIFDQVKQRLAGLLSAAERQALVAALLGDLLNELAQLNDLDGVLIASSEPQVAALLPDSRFIVVAEPAGVEGLNAAVSWALTEVQSRGASHAVVLHGDLAIARAEDISRLLNSVKTPNFPVAIAPDWRGDGSNGMAFVLPSVIDMQYGKDSFHRHCAAIQQQGFEPLVVDKTTLAFDVDTAPDLALLIQLHHLGLTGEKTAALLNSWDVDHRFATSGPEFVAPPMNLVEQNLKDVQRG